jgi:hypothetical protein
MSERGTDTLHRPSGDDDSSGSTTKRSGGSKALRVGTAIVLTGAAVAGAVVGVNQLGKKPSQGGDAPAGVPRDGPGERYPQGANDLIRTDLLRRPGVAEAAGRLLTMMGGSGTVNPEDGSNYHHTDDHNPGISYDRTTFKVDGGRSVVTIQFGGDRESMEDAVQDDRKTPVDIPGAEDAYCVSDLDALHAFGDVPVSVEVSRTDQPSGFTQGCQGPIRDLAAALVAAANK